MMTLIQGYRSRPKFCKTEAEYAQKLPKRIISVKKIDQREERGKKKTIIFIRRKERSMVRLEVKSRLGMKMK